MNWGLIGQTPKQKHCWCLVWVILVVSLFITAFWINLKAVHINLIIIIPRCCTGRILFFLDVWFVKDGFTSSDMENKNSRAWPSSSIIFLFLCSKHPAHNGLAQRKTHFLPEAAKILIKTQRSVQQLPRCMSSNGNTWGRQRGRSAACNSLTEGEERRRPEVTGAFTRDKENERGGGG